MNTQNLYEKALRSYLLTKYNSAASSCLKAIHSLEKEQVTDNLRLNIWTLYLNIASILITLPNSAKSLGIQDGNLTLLSNQVWRKIVSEGYQDHPGLIDPRIVSTCVIMNIKLDEFKLARDIVEEWFAALPDTVLDHISRNQDNDPLSLGYIDIVDLYVSRILTVLGDYESANTFLQYNSILSQEKINSLQQKVQEYKLSTEKEEQKKKQQKEEQEKARLEAERKELERREAEERQRQKEKEAEEMRKTQQEESLLKQNEIVEPAYVANKTPAAVPTSRSVTTNNHNQVQKWLNQLSAKGIATSGTILILIFALFALLRGQRGRLSAALQSLMNKLWQTFKMGTKVTYI